MRAAWKGSITLAGLGIPVEAYSTVRGRSADSLKMLDTEGRSVKQAYLDGGGKVLDARPEARGIETPEGIVPLTPEQLTTIRDGERSSALAGERFPLRSSVPLDLATARFALRPGKGGDEALAALWAALKRSKRVMVCEWTRRAGSRPALAVMVAESDGPYMVELPYVSDLTIVPEWTPASLGSAKVTRLMGDLIERVGDLSEFAHESVVDTYHERREALIAEALAGDGAEVIPLRSGPPDLMAALTASLDATESERVRQPAEVA
jgi:non-homologous end joining protein Ku